MSESLNEEKTARAATGGGEGKQREEGRSVGGARNTEREGTSA